MSPVSGRPWDRAYDNPVCGSFFATLECELLARRRFTSQAEARMAFFSYIEGWYNPARRHSGIGCLSSLAYEEVAATPIGMTMSLRLIPVYLL
jgi:putative transposase